MSILSSPVQAPSAKRSGRYMLGLLLVSAALLIFAVDTQPAQADVVVTAVNFLLNPSFERGTGGTANKWDGFFLSSGDKRVCNQSYAGSCSFKMTGDNSLKWLVQCTPFINTDAGNQFKIKFWVKSKSLVIGGEATIYVDFYNGGGFVDSDTVSIPGGTKSWTLRQGLATADADYDEICIYLQIAANSGKLWFDKGSLVYVGGP